MARDPTAGPDSGPEAPFPIRLSGRIIKGFGRGSKELGIPTANIPITGLDVGGQTNIESGVYFGYAGLSLGPANSDVTQAAAPIGAEGASPQELSKVPAISSEDISPAEIYPAVLSIGYNPFYKNEKRTVEIHIMHKFGNDFYGALLNLTILGFIRQERDYPSLEALVEDINVDVEVARRSLKREAYATLVNDEYLRDFDWARNAEAASL